jgi:hypothetical protein
MSPDIKRLVAKALVAMARPAAPPAGADSLALVETLAHIDKTIARITRETIPSALRTSQKDQSLG